MLIKLYISCVFDLFVISLYQVNLNNKVMKNCNNANNGIKKLSSKK